MIWRAELFLLLALSLGCNNEGGTSSHGGPSPASGGGGSSGGSGGTPSGGVAALCSGNLTATSYTAPVNSSSAGYNTMPIQVGPAAGASLCTDANVPCGSVTVCIPGTSNCQVVPNMLIDTGSYGVRIYTQALQDNLCNGLTPVEADSYHVGECASFGSANLWGGVAKAGVQLGGEPVVEIPIQIVNADFASVPSACGTVPKTPTDTGFNGILGLGLEDSDCGPPCAQIANNEIYFSCGSTACGSTTLPVSSQVQHPVSAQTTTKDNNGVIFQLGALTAPLGAPTITGSVIFGIDSGQANNSSSGQKLTLLQASPIDSGGNFVTVNGNDKSFLDSGSNVLLVPTSQLPTGVAVCAQTASYLCVTASGNSLNLGLKLSANSSTSPSLTTLITIYDFVTLDQQGASQGNQAFDDIAGPAPSSLGGGFDLGLPFFFGRSVRVGIDGKTSSLGTGPYWAL